MADDQALLDSIDAAIVGNPEGITAYEIHGRRIERMNLNQLLRARATVQARVDRASRGGMFRVIRPMPK